jgi:catechol 2,3-dioxygenase-like lactoylglutathione lyase family enzyme
MVKLRTGDPWMRAAEYARTLSGVTLNLLVQDIPRALPFHLQVLGAELVYSDPDFAVLRAAGAEWMLHADHTYEGHPLRDNLGHGERRGAGMEIRLHGRDPDQAVSAARSLGLEVMLEAKDKGHGVREAFLADLDGYVWVPDVLLPPERSAGTAPSKPPEA